MTLTVDQLVALAHRLLAEPETSLTDVRALAQGVSDLLAEGSECGYEEPEIVPWSSPPEATHAIRVPASWATDVPSREARTMGRMLFRSADEADAL